MPAANSPTVEPMTPTVRSSSSSESGPGTASSGFCFRNPSIASFKSMALSVSGSLPRS